MMMMACPSVKILAQRLVEVILFTKLRFGVHLFGKNFAPRVGLMFIMKVKWINLF